MSTKFDPRVIALALSLVAFGPVGPAVAQAGSQRQQAQARLEQRVARIDSELGQKTGGMQRADLLRQRREIDAAIKQLQSGRQVSTEQIDQILGEVSFERAQ